MPKNADDFVSIGDFLQLGSWGGELGIVTPVSLSEVLNPTVPEDEDDPLAMLRGRGVVESQIAEALEDSDDLPINLNEPAAAGTRSLAPTAAEDDDDPSNFMSSVGVSQQREVPDITKPWMKYHKFELVKTIERLNEIVDASIAAGSCSLDLETQGLDNRIYMKSPAEIKGAYEVWWDGPAPEKIPQTVHKIVGYCISYDGLTGFYCPVRHTAEGSINVDVVEAGKAIQRLCRAAIPELTDEGKASDPIASPLIKKAGIKIFFWHAKFDQEFLYPVTGIEVWHPDSFEDGMLLYFSRNTSDKDLGLKTKSKNQLFVKDEKGTFLKENNVPIPYEMIDLKELFIRGRKIDFPSLHPEEPGVIKYACSDAICTYLHCVKPEIAKMVKDPLYMGTYRLEKQTTAALRAMERPRVLLDVPYFRSLYQEARTEADGYEKQIVELAAGYGFHSFDPLSTQQLSAFLFGDPSGLNIEPKPAQNEASGQYKTDADTLEKLVEDNPDINPILVTIVKYRQVEKVIGTYLDHMVSNCDHNNEARVQFKQTGAATGRISAPAGKPEHGFAGFPPHGIPSGYDDKKPKVATSLRKGFIAHPGYTMVKVDFAGEELRIVTNLSGEPVWVKEFLEGEGDLHSITARAFFGKQDITKQERQQGKIANFSLVYGGGVQAIMRATGCNQHEAARRKANFDKTLPTFAAWVKGQKAKVHKDKGIKTPFGRWIAIPEIDSADKMLVGAAERWSINYPIQGAGADIMKMALVLLHKEFLKRGWIASDSVRMILTVHDEIVFEVRHELVPVALPVIERLMTEPARMVKWRVPLEVEPLIDLTWDAKYDYHKILHGKFKPAKPEDKALKHPDIRVGNWVFHAVPPWLEGIVIPDWQREGFDPDAKEQKLGESIVPQVVPVQKPASVPAAQEAPVPKNTPSSATPAPVQAVTQAQVPELKNGKVKVFLYQLPATTQQSVRLVGGLLMMCADPEHGEVLHLVCATTNETLIDPSLNIRVDPTDFRRRMSEHNM